MTPEATSQEPANAELVKAVKYCAGYCEQVAHDGTLPSWDWFTENAPTLRAAAAALSAAQRLESKADAMLLAYAKAVMAESGDVRVRVFDAVRAAVEDL